MMLYGLYLLTWVICLAEEPKSQPPKEALVLRFLPKPSAGTVRDNVSITYEQVIPQQWKCNVFYDEVTRQNGIEQKKKRAEVLYINVGPLRKV